HTLLKTDPLPSWSTAQSAEFYGLNRWGSGHFGVDDDGFITVQPQADGCTIRIQDVIDEASDIGMRAPFVIRFQDLLRHRVEQLNKLFRKAIAEEDYAGRYRGVFPIKVNQLREVVEEIVDAGEPFDYGLEAGSKPELVIALAMHEGPERLIICNGYKDQD